MGDSNDRLRQARIAAGFESAAAAAARHHWNASTYRSHENGQTPVTVKAAREYAAAFGVTPAWIITAEGKGPDGTTTKSATILRKHAIPERKNNVRRLRVYGLGMASKDGKFAFVEGLVADVMCPPGLEDVPDAYGVYVSGDSMEDRYYNGEVVYVHPRKPVSRGDFVVVQLSPSKEGDPDEGMIKQYQGVTTRHLLLRQFKPRRLLKIDRRRVVHIHRIVLAGDS